MIKLFCLLILNITSIAAFSQNKTDNVKYINGFEKFKLGDSITKFKGLLSCAEGGQPRDVVSLGGKLSCKSFQYSDSVQLGEIKLSSTSLLVDSSKKINEISFYKFYKRENEVNIKKPADDDFDNLKNYLTQVLKVKSNKYKDKLWEKANTVKKRKGIVWIKDDIEYVLRTYNYEKLKKPVIGMLWLKISKVD